MSKKTQALDDINDIIQSALKRTSGNTKEDVLNTLNKMRDKNIINSRDTLLKARDMLMDNYEDSFKSTHEYYNKLRKVKNIKKPPTNEAYQILTSDQGKIGISKVKYTAEKNLKKEIEKEAAANLKKSAWKNLGHVGNAYFAISDYKDAREAGHSTVGSIAKAGFEFAKGEMLGGWYWGAMLAKSAPTIAVSAIEGINTMSRSMNSVQKRQVFGDSYFADTQQLATMRQSGMELARMSQYNLQQTLMGNEAEHLHRL